MAFAAYSYRSDPEVPAFDDSQPLVVIDGFCALCAGDARFVLQNDRRRRFRITTAQSPIGAALYRHFGLDYGEQGTFLLLQGGVVFTRSDGALRVLAQLRSPWPLVAALFRAAPASWRDAAYNLVARQRYAWFGRRAVCYAPAPADADRFL